MQLQLLSDLHLELAPGYHPVANPQADITVVAGDLGHSPDVLERLADWPTPILFVPGNHEYDHQDFDEAEEELRETASVLGMRYLNNDALLVDGVRFLGTTRWCDFDLLGPERRDECMRTADYYFRVMGTARYGRLFGPDEARDVGLAQRAWLQEQLRQPCSVPTADPRYGLAKSTAAFCNDDEDLIPLADLWLHGHLHCPHDYAVHNGRPTPTRVVCNPRGYAKQDEHLGFREALLVEVPTTRN
jgi:hypothetical protein